MWHFKALLFCFFSLEDKKRNTESSCEPGSRITRLAWMMRLRRFYHKWMTSWRLKATQNGGRVLQMIFCLTSRLVLGWLNTLCTVWLSVGCRLGLSVTASSRSKLTQLAGEVEKTENPISPLWRKVRWRVRPIAFWNFNFIFSKKPPLSKRFLEVSIRHEVMGKFLFVPAVLSMRQVRGCGPTSHDSSLFILPVIVLEALVAEEQVSEAEAGRQRRHLALLLLHPESGDV